MSMTEESPMAGVRTVLHLSPAVCAAALSAAQRYGMSLQEWLDHRVSVALADDSKMSKDGLNALAPWSLASADLFVQVANHAPETLSGRWALLYERVKLEPSLWHLPTQTVEDVESGMPPDEPFISPAKLRAAWPRLCAATFCV